MAFMSDVFGGVVDAAERGDEAAVGLEERQAFRRLLREVVRVLRQRPGLGYDALATAPPQSCQRVLARHTPGQTQPVGQQLGGVGVVLEAQAALSETAAGVVNRGQEERRDARLAPQENAFVV